MKKTLFAACAAILLSVGGATAMPSASTNVDNGLILAHYRSGASPQVSRQVERQVTRSRVQARAETRMEVRREVRREMRREMLRAHRQGHVHRR